MILIPRSGGNRMKHHALDDVSHAGHCNALYQRSNLFRAVRIISGRYIALMGTGRRTAERMTRYKNSCGMLRAQLVLSTGR